MGLVDCIVRWRARSHGKGTLRAMLISGLSFREKYRDQEVTSGFLAAEALGCRPYWARTGIMEFVYKPTGEGLSIDDNDSLAEVTKRVVVVEITYMTADRSEEVRLQARTRALEGVSEAMGGTAVGPRSLESIRRPPNSRQ